MDAASDFASVNWHEAGSVSAAQALLERGIGVEAGLWNEAAVEAWLTWPHRLSCCRVLLELPPDIDPAAVPEQADRLLDRVREGVGDRVPVLLHGQDASCWPTLRTAAHRGLSTRIGLEDVLTMPDGSPAPDNAALVRAAREVLTRHAPGDACPLR